MPAPVPRYEPGDQRHLPVESEVHRRHPPTRVTRSRVNSSTRARTAEGHRRLELLVPADRARPPRRRRRRPRVPTAPVAPPSPRAAPSASAFTTSVPRADPAVDVHLGAPARPRRRSRGSTSAVAAMPSSTRPPWFDTAIAAAPASTARAASSPRSSPFTTNGQAAPLAEPGEVVEGERRVEVR